MYEDKIRSFRKFLLFFISQWLVNRLRTYTIHRQTGFIFNLLSTVMCYKCQIGYKHGKTCNDFYLKLFAMLSIVSYRKFQVSVLRIST